MGKVSYLRRLGREFFLFARLHKVYWILPVVAILLLMALVIFTSQAATPFIYTLF